MDKQPPQHLVDKMLEAYEEQRPRPAGKERAVWIVACSLHEVKRYWAPRKPVRDPRDAVHFADERSARIVAQDLAQFAAQLPADQIPLGPLSAVVERLVL